MKEYEILRNEIINNLDSVRQYNSILYTVVASILAFTFDSKNYLACMLPYIVIISIYNLTVSRHKGICKIGAYLNVFLEGEDYNWERRHAIFDKEYMDPAISALNWKSLGRFYLLSCVCSAITIYKLITEMSYNTTYKGVISLIIVIFSFFVCRYFYKNAVDYIEEREKMIKHWEKIKEEELRHAQ